ncbi:hypothetical protein JTE90_011496 [Oedothorax gibbosus]|uniref:FERM domain-containing protein n=1 Tax=Oedothorax gibbosus TaxID=931172 RepID=A0AAV6VE47_9ARAC|nr:hypothetical protein JTE90_011496 [Oedothorax gibbosus]
MPNLPLYSNSITRICHSMIFGRRSAEVEEQWKGEKCLSMRQSLHKALTTCRAPLPPGKKYVAVQFLNKELIFYVVDTKGKGQEIFDEASKHLALSDSELFGLAFYQDGEYIFIDPNIKVSKYAVRSWKTQTNGITGDGQPLLILHMRVKYYVDCHLLINEKIVRHHYYLQLRENLKHYCQPISEEKSFLLAALALQADLGNYSADRHKDRYFDIASYFPPWIVKKIGEDFIIKSMPSLHKDNAGLSRGEAQVGYIQGASEPTAPHNLHLYRMRRKKGKVWGDVWLGIADSGIHIYEEVENLKSLLSTFSWCDIAKLHFEKKKFEILSEGSPHCRRFTYFVQSEELAKHLLLICRMTHHFHMANQCRVSELKKLELDGGKPYREAYIYTDKLDQAREKQNSLHRSNLTTKHSVPNCNGTSDHMKKVTKVFSMPWKNGGCLENAQCVSSHHSMETLPLTNGGRFSSELKYKSQSIPCLPDCSLTPYSPSESSDPQHWRPPSTNTSTLLSRSSCNTDSSCSCLSLASGSTVKGGCDSWVKCDSFEEIAIPQKVCISTFSDGHVRTASVYDLSTAGTDNCRLSVVDKTSDVGKGGVSASKRRNGCETQQTNSSTEPALNYATSSLEPPASNKTADVKRSPSFNLNPTVKPTQKPQRQYISHNRTAIRIGVSSLSRDQRLPLSLFNDRGITGSEPNLHAPGNETSQWLQRKLNSQSELSLNVLEQAAFEVDGSSVKDGKKSKQSSLPDVCNDGEDFCIPPPPAYRNEGESNGDLVDAASAEVTVSTTENKNNPQEDLNSDEAAKNAPEEVLDIHQLRERSRDLELPLLSALCNDRSLLMLPKTVPTCSRQRHLGKKDPLRFSRTTSLPNGDGMEAFLVNSGRPISWHVDSSQVPHCPEVSKPCSASWDYSIQRDSVSQVIPRTASLDNAVGQHVLDSAVGMHVSPPPRYVDPQRPVSLDYGNHHPMVAQASRLRTVSLENGIHQGLCTEVHSHKMTSMDYGNSVHYPFANDASRLRTGSLENGIHQGVSTSVHQQQVDYNNHMHYEDLRLRTMSLENGMQPLNAHQPRTVSMDYSNHPHFLYEALRQKTISLENGLHQGELNQRHVSTNYNAHQHYALSNEALRPRTVSLENGIFQSEVQNQLVGMSLPVPSLPPTILTSFVKTPVKQVRGFRDHSNFSDNYRYDKSQMIPTKLLAGSLSSITNGRLYQKGLSS